MAIQIQYPFVVLSDIHLHNWTTYSSINFNGINSRLECQLECIKEAALTLKKAGGKDIIITGDLFHTRGSIVPSVINPTYECFKALSDKGFAIHALPGNHDSEFRDANWLGNAFHSFKSIPNFHVYEAVTWNGDFCFIPWVDNKEELINHINQIEVRDSTVVFLHVGIDGVIDNLKGKIGKSVLEKGFKYVFSGDYHNHRDLGSGIYSVGALTHHSWGDVGSIAGYLLVSETGVKQIETTAPKFVDFESGEFYRNYVRIKGVELTQEDADDIIANIKKKGAEAINDQSTRPHIVQTDASKVIKVGFDIKDSVRSYVERTYGDNAPLVLKRAERIMGV